MDRDRSLQLVKVQSDGTGMLVYHFRAGSFLRRFVHEGPLWVRYAGSMAEVPPAVTAIPFAALMAPLVWCVGGRLEMPEMETDYVRSLAAIRSSYQAMFPEISFDGEVVVDQSTIVPMLDLSETAMLFSGGVDSLYSLFRHRQENPHLIAIRGLDVRMHQTKLWQQVNVDQIRVAEAMNLRRTWVESNYLDVVRQWSLDLRLMDVLPNGWYSGISHGQVLLGLCAPWAWREGIGRLLIASSFPQGEKQRYGSNPLFDESSCWSGLCVSHDGKTESRQDKLDFLAESMRTMRLNLPIRVCSRGADGRNCSICEKCSRTLVGLILAGADPEQAGFVLRTDTPQRIRQALENNQWQLWHSYYWRDLQRAAISRPLQSNGPWRDFGLWLRQAELDRWIQQQPLTRWEQAKRWLRRSLPFPYYDRLRRWKRQLWGPRFDY